MEMLTVPLTLKQEALGMPAPPESSEVKKGSAVSLELRGDFYT